MRRIIITVILCLTLSVFSPFSAQAEDELKDCNPNGTTVMGIGDIIACAIDPVADSDFFRFSGSAGQTFRLTLTETGGGYWPAPCLELFDPNNESVDAWCAQNTGASRQITIDKSGTYTLLVYENGDNETVAYNIALQRKFPSPPEALTLFYGDVHEEETISPVADSDIFLFKGAQNEFIRLTLSETGGGYWPAPCLELFDPNKESVDAWCAQNTGVSRQFKLEKTGTYTVLVYENGDNETVVYNIALQRKFPPPPDALPLFHDDVNENETISPVADSDIFLFGGAQNDLIRLTLSETGGGYWPAPCLELFGPDKQLVDAWCAQNTGVSRQFELDKTGTYTVLVYENGDNETVVYNLGLSCISGICPPPPPRSPFADVPRSHWAYKYIKAIYDEGITTGCGGGKYCPDDDVTRAQMAAFIVRAVDEAEPPANYCATGSPFSDVPSGHWACKYIKRLFELGITTGCGGGKYCPEDDVTRAQMAAFLVRAVDEEEPPDNYCATGSPFSDISSDHWACKYIKRLFELGITTGCGGGKYCPNDNVTRAQMAAFLARAFLGID